MDEGLNLNEIHSDLISDYLRFTKYQLGQRLKSIDYCFTSLLNCRIRESETYLGNEVKRILQDLQEVVRGEAETEFNDASHTNALMLQELLKQAEEWHLTLSVNVSDLENGEKLSTVKRFDEKLSQSQPKMNITVTQVKQIIPVEDMNVASALKKEIVKLTSDNDTLQAKLKELSEKELPDPNKILNIDDSVILKLKEDLARSYEEIDNLKIELMSTVDRRKSQCQLQTVQETVTKLSQELESTKLSSEEQLEKLKKDLETRENKLRQVQSNLLLAEKELDKKFQATSAFVNMKKLMLQKNSKIKILRKRLESFGGGLDGDEDEDEEAVGFHV